MTTRLTEEFEDSCAIVIDNGSCMVKAGFSGDDAPRACFHSMVGRPNFERDTLSLGRPVWKEVYVGDEARIKQEHLKMAYGPVDQGIICSWDEMEKLWQHTFHNELRVPAEDQGLLLTEAPLNPKCNREKATEVMFETFNVPSFYTANQAVLSIYASGRTTGIVLDSGYGVSRAVPIYEGYALPHAIHRLDIGGFDLTRSLMRMLNNERAYDIPESCGLAIVQDIKEKLCFVAQDYSAELRASYSNASLSQEYKLPDGEIIQLGEERIRIPEILFDPRDYVGLDQDGIQHWVYRSIDKCDNDIRKDLWTNIVLTGGSTLFDGMRSRLKKELLELSKGESIYMINVVAPPERKYSAWIGGSILTSLSTFQDMWITKAEYDESGPTIVHKKCF